MALKVCHVTKMLEALKLSPMTRFDGFLRAANRVPHEHDTRSSEMRTRCYRFDRIEIFSPDQQSHVTGPASPG